ncbi:hypothetical protein L249_6368 [Ophiocordyceps polyrhachis-furcata BCC 54312]|uniref:Telomere length regulation protein conserved domain-containing protein n=1 Tax=Ophiocordyceps polyrhachis-furcata BCC 54312 TaxID=1330021 RepID=A0A367LL65_9HYPO|nr:hypothetical protein L249_6368 [Ophiocordyceps polyrhachis-furcata BCC 54312]
MDLDLTPVSTTYLRTRHGQELSPSETRPAKKVKEAAAVTSTDEALHALKSQPDYEGLITVLRYLDTSEARLRLPTPASASIIHALVSEIVPNYWILLRENSGTDEAKHLELLLTCLRSVTGLNAIITHCKALIQESKLSSNKVRRPDVELNLRLLLDVLASLLAGHGSIRLLWEASVTNHENSTANKAQSQQLAALVANGRILSTAAEASVVVGKETLSNDLVWLSSGVDFSVWIGRNLSSWASTQMSEGEVAFAFDVFQRSMSLGYTGTVVNTMIDELLLSPRGKPSGFTRICFHQPRLVKKIIDILLQHASQRFLNNAALGGSNLDATVAAVAGVIEFVVGDDEMRTSHLVSWCTASSGAGLGDPVGIRRAVVTVLAKNKETISAVLEKSLAQFGDQLYIKHAAVLQQEVHTQVLLLSAGYVARLAPIKLAMLLRSGTYLSAISNRIAATQARARFLGMVVGEILSALAEGKAKKLDFHMEEMETDEADWLKGLTKTEDHAGSFDSLVSSQDSAPPTSRSVPTVPKPQHKVRPKPGPVAPLPKAIIEEIDSSDDDDDDLVPYAKGSDPEDSDDDATLVQRNKPRAPVYVRDLIAYLRDTENYDKQKLALQSAPDLISRKANYGTEISSHADELAGLLVGLQDKFELQDFVEKRQQGMIALVVAQPKSMAPWFARSFFEGDFSLAQRTSILVTLGLSARELAGQQQEARGGDSFASKRLPEKIERLFLDAAQRPEQQQPASSRLEALPPNALGAITKSLTSSFLEPLAAQAADDTTGPDALKLETFTQRYKSKSNFKARPRVRAIANTTAALLASSFFAPLTAHFQLALGSSKPMVVNPAILSLYLQTLGIVVDAAGPSALALPQMTSELWHLLLRVRPHVLGDVDATRGWLFALTVLIDVNENRMRTLCEELGRELVETRETLAAVFARTRGDDGGEENDVKMLAAGALIKLGEVVEKYQALLIGDLVSFS